MLSTSIPSNNNPKDRIKPRLLREQKTEALLIFVRTTLEQYFIDLKTKEVHFKMGTEEDNRIIDDTLKVLLFQLQETVVNGIYLSTVAQMAVKSKNMMLLAKKEESTMVYYNSIVKQLEISLDQGQNWIPEQLVLCLLSEWILEEGKSSLLYPYLQTINYTDILSRYDKVIVQAKKDEDLKKVQFIKNMYQVSSELILKLKNTTYKVNTKRISKSRRKK